MKYFFLYSLFFFSFISFGQKQKKIDSLKIELSSPSDDNQHYEILNLIIREYLIKNIDTAKIYTTELLKLSRNTKDKNIAIKGYNLSSNYFYYSSQLDSSLFYVKKSLLLLKNSDDHKLQSDLYRKLAILSKANSDFEGYEKYGKLALSEAKLTEDWELYTSALLVLANKYYFKNDYSNALKHYLEVDSVHTINNGVTANLSLAYNNIALIYIALRNERTLDYLDKSIAIHKKLDNKFGVNDTDRIRANYYNDINDVDKAIFYFNKILPFFESLGNPSKLVEIYTELIQSYTEIEKFAKAEQFLKKVENIIDNHPSNKIILNQMQYSFGVYYLKRKSYYKAIYYFKLAKKTALSQGTDYHLGERNEIFKGLVSSYAGIKDYEKAYITSEKLLILKDKLNIQNKEKLTTDLELKYQTQKKEQEIVLLKSKNESVEQQKANQRNQLLGGIGFTTLAGLFFFFLYRNRQKTTKKLQELDKAKSNFFANISHEFRTPLTLISGPLQIQLQKDNLKEEDKSNFEMMYRNSTRLLSLVDQLLDISKIEAGSLQLKISKNELMPFIGSLTDGFTYAAKQKELNYSINNNPTTNITWFDKDVIEKIIVNLLSNAIKYTPTKGSIVCNAFVKENQFYFEIKNTGLGLSKDELTKIFERFYQLNEDEQGVGIGLALVKELVNLHKGTITVESIPDEWTTFKVVLPINKEAFKEIEFIDTVALKSINPKVSGETSDVNIVTDVLKDFDSSDSYRGQDSENPILLIVDDNADIRTYINNIFKGTYTILTAKNGQEGINLAIEYIPDIIISDIMMPVKNGIELCNTLKVDERTSHIPIILLTAKAGEQNEIQGIKTGADDYVTKPFNEELLKLRVQKLIESRNKLQLRYSQEVILRPKDIAITSIDEQFLERLQKILDDKLVETSFNVEDFSQAIGMSRMQLHRKLKALTGLSATEFIRSQRLKLAAQLLKKSEINVSQVGYSVGFNDHAYFSKCFKEMYHCTPTKYAKKG